MRGRISERFSGSAVATIIITLGLLLGEFQLAPPGGQPGLLGFLAGAFGGLLAGAVLVVERIHARRRGPYGDIKGQGRRAGDAQPEHKGYRNDLLLCLALLALGSGRACLARDRFQLSIAQAQQLEGEAYVEGFWTHAGGRDLLLISAARRIGEQEVQRLRSPLRLLCSFRLLPLSVGSGEVPGNGPVEGFVRIEAARGQRGPGAWNDCPYLRARGAGGWARPVMLVAKRDVERCPGGGLVGGSRIGKSMLSARLCLSRWAQWIRGMAGSLRSTLAEEIRARLGGGGGAFAACFFLGRRAVAGNAEGATETLRRAGVGHLLAVSGFHVGLVGGILASLIWLLPVGSRSRWLLLATALPAYGLLVGWGTSVLRAVWAGSLWCLLRATGRCARPQTLLLLLLVLSIWFQPGCWREAGFQLSYLVTLALLGAVGPREQRHFTPATPQPKIQTDGKHHWTGRGGRVAATLMAAQSTAWPLVLTHFGWASPFFLLSNAVLLPLAALLPAVLLPGLLLAQLPGFPADVALSPAQCATDGFLLLAARLGDICDQWLVGRQLSRGLGLSAALLIALVWCAPVRLPARAAAALCLAGLVTLTAPTVAHSPAFLMLDVGQGEAWVCLWSKETWVVDVGPEPGRADRPRRCLEEALRSLGRTKIDRLILTHDDLDHTGGIEELRMAGIPIGTIYHPRGWKPCERIVRWLAAMEATGVSIRGIGRGDTLRTAGGIAVILHPDAPACDYEDDNAGALAIAIEVPDLRMLITSDVPGTVEDEWISLGLVKAAGVLSAAHHGSASSTTERLLRAVTPRALLVSAGRRNRFGHPAERVLMDAAGCGAEVFRTDRDGTIVIACRHGNWQVRGWSSRRTLVLTGSAGPECARARERG